MDTGEFERHGLYDPDAANADERLALVEWLAGRGITIEQMAAAHERGQLVSLAADLVREGAGPWLTLQEVAGRAGISPEFAGRSMQAAGFPPPDLQVHMFRAEDVELFRSVALASEFFGVDAIMQFARVVGASLARIAESAASVFLVNVEAPMKQQAATELELAQSQVIAVEQSTLLDHVLATVFHHHFDEAIRRFRLARETSHAVESVRLAVGFVDLIGFTRLSRELSTRELAAVVTDFEAAASDAVAIHDGRLVKLIGDEAMYVMVDAADACDVALALCRHVDEHPVLDRARGAIASGSLVTSDGDYYGPLVNLASRAVKLAEPGAVLVTDEVRSEAETRDGLRFLEAGTHELRGFDEPVSFYSVTAV